MTDKNAPVARRAVVTKPKAKAPAKAKTAKKAKAVDPALKAKLEAEALAKAEAKKQAIAAAEQKVADTLAAVENATKELNEATDDDKKVELVQALRVVNDAHTAAKTELDALMKPEKPAKAMDESDMVLVEVTKPFKFVDHASNGTVHKFKPGTQKVSSAIANHWWSKANGMKIVKG